MDHKLNNVTDDKNHPVTKKKRKKRMIKILLIVLIIFIAIGLDVRLKVVHYKFKGSCNVKIAHITDLHGCRYGDNMQTLVDAIESEQPDIIVYTGDIFDDDVPYKNSRIFMERTTQYPSFYVNGNHEFYSRDLDTIYGIIEENKVTILNDETVSLDINGDKLNISGIEDPMSRKNLNDQLSALDVEEDAYNVLLSHRPENINTYLTKDFDLILCGHAHGGQWRIPYLVNGVFAPNQGIFPKYAGGLYDFDDTHFIVSRGLARESTRWVPRIYNRPELVIIEIEKE